MGRTECSETSNRQCRTFPKQECIDVPKLQCVQVPKVDCQDLNRQSCSEVPVQIVNRRQEESAHWSHPLRPKKLATVSVKLSRGMSVSPSPSKSAMTSMNLAKCAMMCPRKFATTFQPL